MKRLLITTLLLLVLAIPAVSEEIATEATFAPEAELAPEATEFALAAEPEPAQTPVEELQLTPTPTLEPGSMNYPADKVNFEGEIWSILTRRWGLNDFQASGLMSSLYLESSFCPYNAQNHTGIDDRGHYTFRTGDGVGFGLCQWTTKARKSGLQKYAVEHGDPNLVWDFDIQMGYMTQDINLPGLKATESLYDATEWAVLHFERPSQKYANSWPGSRYEIALQIYEAHVGRPYEEPELSFEVSADALSLDEGCEFTVTSNYYWRLRAPDWLEIECISPYDPETWESYPCGYAGETSVRLRRKSLPWVRDWEARFEIYNTDKVVRAVPLAYTGKTAPEVAFELVLWILRVTKII